MKHLPALVAVAMSVAVLPAGAFAQSTSSDNATLQTSPGKATLARALTVVATVTEVDAAARDVTLKRPDGTLLPLKVGSEVRNLEQVRVGDRVRVRYQESLSLTLQKEGKEPVAATQAADATRTAMGQRPGGEVTEQMEVTADVVALDPAKQSVTLRGPDRTVDLWVRDPAQFKLVKVGDQVHAVYTKALALSVEAEPAVK